MPDCKVSVIVPVYNSSKYLHQCIDSILSQTFTDFELICVDDGSTDNSLSILREYEKKDSRVRIISQNNQYAGVARNTGKAAAQGEYLVFWDSDDFFSPNALQLMYDQSRKDNADVCICSARQFFEDLQKPLPSSGYISGKYVPKEMPFNAGTVPDYILNITTAHPWNKMFRSAYISSIGLDFQPTRNGNDIFFVINAIARADRITIVNKPLVNYRINQSDSLFGSLTDSPLTPINNWIATRESLLAHQAFPKRSFDNKILNTLVYFLHNINNWNAFQETFLFLQQEALAKLDLTEQDGDYYYSECNAECLHHLLNDSPEQFLVFFSNLTYRQSTQKNGRNQELITKVRKLRRNSEKSTQHIESLRSLTSHQSSVIQEYSKLVQEQDGQINELSRELELAKKELQAVSFSSSYRLGRALTAAPRGIKKFLKGNR